MALLENAISQNSVLGKDQGEDGEQEDSARAWGRFFDRTTLLITSVSRLQLDPLDLT